jgi:hypothetical protein
MKQKLLILVNDNWPTFPAKMNDLKTIFFPEIDLSIDTKETHFRKWLPHFLNQWTPPAPRESEEASLFMRTLMALLSTFGLYKREEDQIKETVAELLPKPSTPVAPAPPAPKKSRVEELAHSMEMIETSNQNPRTLGVRLNNPGCLKFATWEKEYGAVPSISGFAKFPTYGLGKQAQLWLLRSAMSGRMAAYIPTARSSNSSTHMRIHHRRGRKRTTYSECARI